MRCTDPAEEYGEPTNIFITDAELVENVAGPAPEADEWEHFDDSGGALVLVSVFCKHVLKSVNVILRC